MSEVKRYNVRMAGLGGQGVVTASHILSNAVVLSNGFSSLVPFFGSEKRNAPVESYVRISNEEIYEIGEIVYPNVLMIFSEQVITLGKSYTMPFYTGLKQDGIILINSNKPIDFVPDEAREMEEKGAKIYIFRLLKWRMKLPRLNWLPTCVCVGLFLLFSGCPTWLHWKDRLKTGSSVKVSLFRVEPLPSIVLLKRNLPKSKSCLKRIWTPSRRLINTQSTTNGVSTRMLRKKLLSNQHLMEKTCITLLM